MLNLKSFKNLILKTDKLQLIEVLVDQILVKPNLKERNQVVIDRHIYLKMEILKA
jgi:hypothetical protein